MRKAAPVILLVAAWLLLPCTAETAEPAPLALLTRIPLPDVAGRIDHLTYDGKRHRLFVAELGNDTIDVVDLDAAQVTHRIGGVKEPQGAAYSVALELLYIAGGGDGMLRAYRGADYSLLHAVKVGGDADNVRIDEAAQRVYVGHGDGALAVLDAATLAPRPGISLKAHPESFQLSPDGQAIYVNVPKAAEIAVLERAGARQRDSWPTGSPRGNYPMAIDTDNRRVLAVFRQPARIIAFAIPDGKIVASAPVCGDSDDVFIDTRRQRIYVVCGEGFVDVLGRSGLEQLARIETAPGARTGLYSPDADRLFIAARTHGSDEAAVWILKPSP